MKKQIQLVVLLIFLLGKTTSAQDNQILDFGKPLKMANVYELEGCVIASPESIGDFATILIDKGDLNVSNNTLPAHCFKILVVSLLTKKVKIIEIKDLQGNLVTEPIGTPFTWTHGADGNIYVATQQGGHLVKIDYKQLLAIDLGKPYNFDGIPSITTLSLGTDLALYGIINKTSGSNIGAYTFRYDYDYTISEKDNTPIDSIRIRAKQMGADNKYTYVRCEADDHILYAIDRVTKIKKTISLYYNGTLLDATKAYEIETYAGDYVYARLSCSNGTAYYWKLHNGTVIDNEGPNLSIRKRTDLIWSFNNIKNTITTIWDEANSRIFYQIGSIIDYVDLNEKVQKVARPTGAMTPYYNTQNQRAELFVHGQRYSIAASLTTQNNPIITVLGGNKMQSVYSTETNFDNSKVLIGSYANGTIQEYNSANEWNIFNNINSPAPYSNNANPLIKYQLHNPINSSNNLPGMITVNAIKKINALHLYVAAGDRARNNPPFYNSEITIAIINPATNQFKNVYNAALFQDYTFGAIGIDQTNNNIILIGNKREAPNQATSKLFIVNAVGEIIGTPQDLKFNTTAINDIRQIEVSNHTLFFYCSNTIYRVNDYTNANATIEIMYKIVTDGLFKAIGLDTQHENDKYIVAAYQTPSNGNYKIVYMPTTTTNNITPGADYNVIKIAGSINETAGLTPYTFSFIENKVYLSGFTSIYGFTPTAINNAPNGGVANISQKSIAVTPNPARDQININYTANANEIVQVQVYSNDGLIVYNKQLNAVIGKNNIPLNISSYATGNFIVKVAGREKMSTAKFIKE